MSHDERVLLKQIKTLIISYQEYLDNQPWMRRYTDLVQEKQRILKDLQAAQGVSEVRDILEWPAQIGATKRPITQAEVLSRFICTWKHILGYTALVIFFPIAVPFYMLWSWRANKTICFWKPKGDLFVKKVNALSQDDNQFFSSPTDKVEDQDMEELNTEHISCNPSTISLENTYPSAEVTDSEPHARVYSLGLVNDGSETINTDDCEGPGVVSWEDSSYLEEDPREWQNRTPVDPLLQGPETDWVVRSYHFYEVPDDPIGFRMGVQLWGLYNTKNSPIYSKRVELSILDYPHVPGYRPEKIVDKYPDTYSAKTYGSASYIYQTKRIPSNFQPEQPLPLLVESTGVGPAYPVLAIMDANPVQEVRNPAPVPSGSFLTTITQGIIGTIKAIWQPPALQGQARFEALCEKLKTQSFMHYADYWDELLTLALPSVENRRKLLRQTIAQLWERQNADMVNLFPHLYRLATNVMERTEVIECCVNLVEGETVCLKHPENYSEKRYVAWNNYLVKWFLAHLPDNYNEQISMIAQIYKARLDDVKRLLLEGNIDAAWEVLSDPPGLEEELRENYFLWHAFPGIQARHYLYKHVVFTLTGHVQITDPKKSKNSLNDHYFLSKLHHSLKDMNSRLSYFGTDKLYKPEYWQKTEQETIAPLKVFWNYYNSGIDDHEKDPIDGVGAKRKLIWEKWLEKEKNIFKNRYHQKCKRGEIISYRAPKSALYANDFLMALCAVWIGNENLLKEENLERSHTDFEKHLKNISGNEEKSLMKIFQMYFLFINDRLFNLHAFLSPFIYQDNLWKSKPDVANHLNYFINNHVRKWMFEDVIQNLAVYQPFLDELNLEANSKDLEEWKWGWKSIPDLEAFLFARKMGFRIDICRDDQDFSVIKSYHPAEPNQKTPVFKIVQKKMPYGFDYYPINNIALTKKHDEKHIQAFRRKRIQEKEKIEVPFYKLHKRSRSVDRIKKDEKFITDTLVYDHINGNGFLTTYPILIPSSQKNSFWFAICVYLLVPALYDFEKKDEQLKSFEKFLHALSLLFPEWNCPYKSGPLSRPIFV